MFAGEPLKPLYLLSGKGILTDEKVPEVTIAMRHKLFAASRSDDRTFGGNCLYANAKHTALPQGSANTSSIKQAVVQATKLSITMLPSEDLLTCEAVKWYVYWSNLIGKEVQ